VNDYYNLYLDLYLDFSTLQLYIGFIARGVSEFVGLDDKTIK